MNRISERIWALVGFAARERNVLVERIGSSSAFLIFDRIVSNLFDYGLYPIAFWLTDIYVGGYKGFLLAGIIMTVLSFLICWLWIYLYDFFEVNLLILEDVRRLRNNGTDKSGWKGMIARILKKGNFLGFLIMSIKYDPFFTSIYMREDEESKGLKGLRNWIIFIGSVAIGNLWWWFPSFFFGTETGFTLAKDFLALAHLTSLSDLLAESSSFLELLTRVAPQSIDTIVVSISFFGIYLFLWNLLIKIQTEK